MTWKTVTIFVLLFCAADAASASMVLSSFAAKGADPTAGQNPVTLSIVGDLSSDWSLPANLHFDDSMSGELQPRSVNATIKSDSEASFWMMPPDELIMPARKLIPESLQVGDFHASDTVASLPTASVAIPLPPALAATAALAPVGLVGWLWKKSKRNR